MIRARFLHFVLTRFILLLACAMLLAAFGARAQQPSPPITGETRTLAQDASTMPAFFVEVRDSLKAKLAERGLDPGKQAFHFVILYNATKPLMASYGDEKQVIAGMLRNFFAPEDRVSLVPYQLWVREDHATWNMPLSQDAAEKMYTKIPDKPERRDGFNGGHDLDAALLTALQKTRDAGLLDHTIFLALADEQFSDTPLEPKNYQMANADAELKKDDIVKVLENPYTGTFEGENPKAHYTVLYRLYLPQNLQPLDAIKTNRLRNGKPRPADNTVTPRDESRAAMWGTASNTPDPTPPGMTTNPIKANSKKPDPPADYTGLLAGVGAIALLGGVGAYFAWLFKPRALKVGVNSLRAATLTFNKPLYLGTADNDKNNMIALDSLPAGLSATEKIARLEVTPLGALRLRGERWKADREPVLIRSGTSRIRLSRPQNPGAAGTATLGSGDSISVQITPTK